MTIRRVGTTRIYRTIAEAYYRAYVGDILLIDEGVYREQISMVSNKYVHLVGNTQNPGLGKVVISPPNETTSRCVTFTDITDSTTIYMEGINFKFPILSTLEPVAAWRCYDTNLVFNGCIINATDKHEYVFDFDVDEINSITLNNCRIIWKDDYVYGVNRARHFERTALNVEYKISKCIFSNSIDNLDTRYFTYPSKYNKYNELSIDNTTRPQIGAETVSDLQYLFDMNIGTRAIWNSMTTNATVIFHTDFGEGNEKKIVYLYYRVSNTYGPSVSVTLYGSNNDTDWVHLCGLIDSQAVYSFTLSGEIAYRYYKFEWATKNIETVSVYEYVLSTENLDYVSFDYTLKSNLVGYGPHYGEFQKHIPDSYYLEGVVSDVLSEFTTIDNVILDEYNSSSKIVLSNSDLTASLSTSYPNQNKAIKAVTSKKTGKWYFEFRSYDYQILTKSRVGFGTETASNGYACGGSDSRSWGMELSTGNFYYGGEVIAIGPIALYSSIVGVALDLSNGKAWFSINGEWVLDGNPSTGVNPIFTFGNNRLFPMVSLQNMGIFQSKVDVIFSSSALNHTIPEGFGYYSGQVKWKINYYNIDTNEYLGYVYSDDDSHYHIETSYSGSHFLICEDADSSPTYNDLIYSNLIPKEYV